MFFLHGCKAVVNALMGNSVLPDHSNWRNVKEIFYYITQRCHIIILCTLGASRCVSVCAPALWSYMFVSVCDIYFSSPMAISKDLCTCVCGMPFYGKQKTFICGGYYIHFCCVCIKINSTELALYITSGKTSYMCSTCTKLQKATRMDDSPPKEKNNLWLHMTQDENPFFDSN
jgi:hypothetical protein